MNLSPRQRFSRFAQKVHAVRHLAFFLLLKLMLERLLKSLIHSLITKTPSSFSIVAKLGNMADKIKEKLQGIKMHGAGTRIVSVRGNRHSGLSAVAPHAKSKIR